MHTLTDQIEGEALLRFSMNGAVNDTQMFEINGQKLKATITKQAVYDGDDVGLKLEVLDEG